MSKPSYADQVRFYGSSLGLSEAECEQMVRGASIGQLGACARELRRKWRERNFGPESKPVDGGIAQVDFWQEAGVGSFVYFVQAVDGGPVKIGMSKDPVARLGELQVGNPNELAVRYVAPGDRALEAQLHERFKDARIRGEWFGLAYLELILTYAGALAAAQIDFAQREGQAGVPVSYARHTYQKDGHIYWGDSGVRFCTQAEVDELREDIQRLWLVNHPPASIAELTGLELNEVHAQIGQMRTLGIYDVGRQRRPWSTPKKSMRDWYVEREAA